MQNLNWESQPAIMTVEEAAKFLRRGKQCIYDLCYTKGFPALKIGRTWRVSKDGLRLWWEKQINTD